MKKRRTSFFYIHPFIYDNDLLLNSKLPITEIKSEDKFYIYIDKILKDSNNKNNIKKLNILDYYNIDKSSLKYNLTDLNKNFNFEINNAEIIFLPENIAFLTIEIEPEYQNLSELYYLNSLFVSFYKKETKPIYIYKKSERIAIKLSPSQKNITLNNFFYNQKYIKNTKIVYDKKNKTINLIKTLSLEGIEKYYKKFNPYKIDKYPFNSKSSNFTRVGFLVDGDKKFLKTEKTEDLNDLHYSTFNVINEILKENNILIHKDTFFTSLFIEFVKTNVGFDYYDNFNPLGTNYLSIYSLIEISEDELKQEISNNFEHYEPLIHNKKHTGFIHKPDFFSIYQAQADFFIIGNQNNILNIVISRSFQNLSYSIYNQRFLAFIFVNFQYLLLHLITTKAVIMYKKKNQNKIKLFIKNVSYLNEAVEDYAHFVNNYNFDSISDEPSLNSSYQFFKKLKNIDVKLGSFKNVSTNYGNIKDIIKKLVDNPVLLILLIIALTVTLNIFGKFISLLSDKIWNLF